MLLNCNDGTFPESRSSQERSTLQVKKRIGSSPRARTEGSGRGVVSQAGGVLLVERIRKTGLGQAMSAAPALRRKPRAVHDPGKILRDVALAVALGGDCLTDVGILRAEPAVFGPVASDPTVSRPTDTLGAAGRRGYRPRDQRTEPAVPPAGPAGLSHETVESDTTPHESEPGTAVRRQGEESASPTPDARSGRQTGPPPHGAPGAP